MAKNFTGRNSNAVSDAGGGVQVEIPATPFQVQANAGVSIPCREVKLYASEGIYAIRVQIGESCTATTGIPIPRVNATGFNTGGFLRLAISDVNLLHFIATSAAGKIDILYRK